MNNILKYMVKSVFLSDECFVKIPTESNKMADYINCDMENKCRFHSCPNYSPILDKGGEA